MFQNISIYPFPDEEENFGAIIIIKDLTEQILFEKEIIRLNRILKGIRNVNQLITMVESEDVLFKESCKLLVRDIGYIFAWIGVAEQETFNVKPVAWEGIGEEITELKVRWDDSEFGKGVIGKAIRTGNIEVINNVRNAPNFKPWWRFAEKIGYQSVCALPLIVDGQVIGSLNIHSDETNIFQGEELELLKEVTLDISFAIKTLRDRKKKEQAEKDLKNSERNTRLIIESSPVSIWITRNDKCLYANPAFVKLFGYETLHNIMGSSVETFFASSDKKLLKQMLQETLTDKEAVLNHEIKALKKNGELFYTMIWLALIEYETKPAILGFAVDTTSEKKLNEQLRQSQKMEAIGTLAGGIAHDFNNILYPILGYAEITLADLPEDSEIRKNMKHIIKSAERARNLVRQILSFSRQSKKELIPVQIHPIVKEAFKLLRASIPSSIQFRQSIHNCGAVMADMTQIHQIVLNLCTNAYYAMRETGGTIEVSLREIEIGKEAEPTHPDMKPGTYVCLSVSDTGVGMDKKTIERIFDPYFTTKPRGEGTGMGLAVVHRIVKNHKGYIRVESEPGKGSVFSIYLPQLSGTEFIETKSTFSAPVPRGNERILLVDDEEENVLMLNEMLKRLGYQVTSNTNSIELFEIFQKNPNGFDLIITDQTMPYMTGEKLAMKVMEIRPDMPIILCTGFSEMVTEGVAKAIGIREYVMKPVSRSEIATIIRKVLGEQN